MIKIKIEEEYETPEAALAALSEEITRVGLLFRNWELEGSEAGDDEPYALLEDFVRKFAERRRKEAL
jgi:hypothetical protein